MERITILIPTRNRPGLARLAAEAALAGSDDDTEVVVADNSDVPLELPGDARLRHLRPEGVLSMPDNWERALAAARGDWVLLLADKYMLVPGAVRLLRRLITPERDVISYGLGQLSQGLAPEREGELQELRARGGRLSWPAQHFVLERDSSRDLRELVAQARYPRELPMLYTACVRRERLLVARERSGRFFLGPCPDVCSALQILAHTSRWTATQYPLVMAQYPSDSVRWSTGGAVLAAGGLSKEFFREFGSTPPPAEQTIAGVIFATMRAFAARRPDLELSLEAGWPSFARLQTWEIEGQPAVRRLGMHWRLLSYTQRPRPRPAAAWAQVRAAAATFLPRLVRRRLTASRTGAGPALVEVVGTPVATRSDALRLLAERLSGAAV